MFKILIYLILFIKSTSETDGTLTSLRTEFNSKIEKINKKKRINLIPLNNRFYYFSDDVALYKYYCNGLCAFGSIYEKHITFKQSHLEILENFYFSRYIKVINGEIDEIDTINSSYINILKNIKNIINAIDNGGNIENILIEVDNEISSLFSKYESTLRSQHGYQEIKIVTLQVKPIISQINATHKEKDHETMKKSLNFCCCVIENMNNRALAYEEYLRNKCKKRGGCFGWFSKLKIFR